MFREGGCLGRGGCSGRCLHLHYAAVSFALSLNRSHTEIKHLCPLMSKQ